jgi:site-specific recombinase XerC
MEHLHLETGTITVYREKTDDTQTHRFKTHARLAAEDYLAELRAQGRGSGPLFVGHQGKRITRYGLYERVRLLGEHLGPTIFRPTTAPFLDR